MKSILSSAEFKVGAFVLIVAVIVGAMSLQVTQDPNYFGRSKKVWFRVKDAAGLVKKSNVKMAGIPVGVIKDIKLIDGEAILELSIQPGIDIPSGSKIEIRANGILGDKYVEVVQGPKGSAPLGDNDEIKNVTDTGSLAALLNEVSKITGSLGEIADAVKSATTGQGTRDNPVGRIVSNLEQLTEDLKSITTANRDKIHEIVDNVHTASIGIADLMNSNNDDSITNALKRAGKSISRLDRSLKNIEEITDKINSGKGTIGKLVNDEKTVEEINEAVASVNELVGGMKKIQTGVEFHSDYMMPQSLTKSYLGVKIQPGMDRYYELAIIDDPKGVVETTNTRSTTNIGTPSENTASSSETKTFKNKVKFTALYAKNFYDFTVKAGLIENSGGVAFDYFLFKKQLRLSVEAYNFSSLRLRSYLRYNVWRGVFVAGGADDMLNKEAYSSYLGAGIFLTNDDIKMLAAGVGLK